MSEKKYEIILYYKYIHIENPEGLVRDQKELCSRLNLKGRILIAHEGINGTLEGLREDIDKYCENLLANPLFSDIVIKRDPGTGSAFPKLAIKLRKEIVATHLGDEDFHPSEITGKYLSAEELHSWFEEKREFYIIDMRNDFEHKVGHFENSIFSGMTNFRDLKNIVKNFEHLKGKTVVTVCTGGVRCEKASGYLLKNGFADVYQLKDGIVTYMRKYPNQKYLGKLYVFDGRVAVGYNIDEAKYQMVGKCEKCGIPSENFVNCAYPECHKHFIACEDCIVNGEVYCGTECERQQAVITQVA